MSDLDVTTPIYDFVRQYAKSNSARLHMPGHKGQNFVGGEKYDITEIDGADELYSPQGIIAESEKNLTAIFGSRSSFYSAEGSSLSVRTMLGCAMRFAKKGGGRKKVIAARNAHKAFLYSAALLDFDIVWLDGGVHEDLYGGVIDEAKLEAALKQNPDAFAVYVTSPDYTGRLCDIPKLSKISRKYGVPLLVDNAHGAYLRFLPQSLHPISLGADMCCDSAHKTLPVLTGGGYVHVSKNAVFPFETQIKSVMEIFGSTSPSYLILSSLDRANAVLKFEFSDRLSEAVERAAKLKAAISDMNYELSGDEPLKVTVKTKSRGYYGHELADALYENGVIPEAYDRDRVIFMLSPYNRQRDFERLIAVLSQMPPRKPIFEPEPQIPSLRSVMSPREAIMSKSELTPICEAAGHILAAPCVSCPPAIPIAMCGDLITDEAISVFKYYGVRELLTVVT